MPLAIVSALIKGGVPGHPVSVLQRFSTLSPRTKSTTRLAEQQLFQLGAVHSVIV